MAGKKRGIPPAHPMNSKEILTRAGTSQRFTFKMLPWLCLWLVTIETMIVLLAVAVFMREPGSGALIYLGVIAAVLGFLGWLTIRGNSDIVINDQTISRVVYGKIWQQFRWDEMDRVVIRKTIDPDSNRGKTIRVFALYKRKRDGQFLSPWGIIIVEKGNNVVELIALLNLYIQKHGIKIVSLIDGEKIVDHL